MVRTTATPDARHAMLTCPSSRAPPPVAPPTRSTGPSCTTSSASTRVSFREGRRPRGDSDFDFGTASTPATAAAVAAAPVERNAAETDGQRWDESGTDACMGRRGGGAMRTDWTGSGVSASARTASAPLLDDSEASAATLSTSAGRWGAHAVVSRVFGGLERRRHSADFPPRVTTRRAFPRLVFGLGNPPPFRRLLRSVSLRFPTAFPLFPSEYKRRLQLAEVLSPASPHRRNVAYHPTDRSDTLCIAPGWNGKDSRGRSWIGARGSKLDAERALPTSE